MLGSDKTLKDKLFFIHEDCLTGYKFWTSLKSENPKYSSFFWAIYLLYWFLNTWDGKIKNKKNNIWDALQTCQISISRVKHYKEADKWAKSFQKRH